MSHKVGEVSTNATETVDSVTVLQIDDVTRCNKLMCCVSLEASDGPTVTADLTVDTGSGVSILPEDYIESTSVM